MTTTATTKGHGGERGGEEGDGAPRRPASTPRRLVYVFYLYAHLPPHPPSSPPHSLGYVHAMAHQLGGFYGLPVSDSRLA